MALTREQKENVVAEMEKDLSSQKSLVFVNFSKISTADLSDLRKQAKDQNCFFKVIKKTLLRLAAQKTSWWNEDLEKGEGSLGVMFGTEDEIAPAKLIYKFSKIHPEVVIRGGVMQESFQKAEDVIELAQLPSYQSLVQQFVGILKAPVNNFVGVLENNYKGLLYCLKSIKN